MPPRFEILAALFSLAAAILCVLLGPIQSWIWNGADSPTWVAQIAHILGLPEAAPASAVEPSSSSPYFRFGRIFFLVYLGGGMGAWSFERSRLCSDGPWWTLRALVLGLAVALAGDLVAYWGGGWYGARVRFVGFWLMEVPALLLLLAASSALGGAVIRYLPAQRRAGWLLVAVGPTALLTTAALRYMPHGPVLPFSIASALLAIECLRTQGEGDRP